MQCPPTKPGVNGMKFHLVLEALSTSNVSILSLSKNIANSLINAI